MKDDALDALYQVTPGKFTAARNALAKARGADGADIKTLEKPVLAAWAVNQLYWRERTVFDGLVKASLAMRKAHVDQISGRTADVAAAEAAHASARRDAMQAIRRLMERAGEKATPATLEAITETLQALPSDDAAPGRLTRPLKPLTFAALMALDISPVAGARAVAPRPSPSKPGPSKKELAEKTAARKAAQKQLREAETAEHKADTSLADAKKAAVQAGRELARVRDRILFLEKQRDDADETVRQRTRFLQDASNARVQAAQALDRLTD